MLENMKKREVLIIEDNPDSLKALFNELKEKNWTYRRTLNLSDAIKVLKGDKHNISLTYPEGMPGEF